MKTPLCFKIWDYKQLSVAQNTPILNNLFEPLKFWLYQEDKSLLWVMVEIEF